MMAEPASDQSRYKRSADFVPRNVAGETLLVPVSRPSSLPATRAVDLFVLNDSGAFLWSALAVPATKTELAQKLMEEFEATADMAARDVDVYMQMLLDIGAVTQAGDEDG
jgi:hypothetical protein